MVDMQTVNAWRNAPRLNAFAPFFERTASGLGAMPDRDIPVPDMRLLDYDLQCMTFWDTHRRLWGHFDKHYFASIPYRLEEECRLGAAILAHCLHVWGYSGRTATFYSLGAGAGTLARALARLGDGRLETLCCSPTDGNRACFFAKQASEHAHFFHGPFFELDAQRYASDQGLHVFRDGFDILLEDTTFQMYGPDRATQLGFIAPRIRKDGLLIQVQKIAHPDSGTYLLREHQKDAQFKTRYFSEAEIVAKQRDVLDTMRQLQVDLKSTIAALALFFRHSVVTWNSGNFYTIVSSNSTTGLNAFTGSMLKPAIPPEYCYEQLPLRFAQETPTSERWEWRPSRPAFK